MKMWKVYNNKDKGQKLTGVFDDSGELKIQWHEVHKAVLSFVFLYWMSIEIKNLAATWFTFVILAKT